MIGKLGFFAVLAAFVIARPSHGDSGSPDLYGLFNGLDHRSQYGAGVFPEPFLVDDSDLEINELRLDWIHQEKSGVVGDEVSAEIEKGFGNLTLEFEVHYERGTQRNFDPLSHVSSVDREEGIGNVDVGARYPLYQFVSADQKIDSTFGAGFELGVPTNSRVSKNAEIVPKVFDDLRIGEHFTLQGIAGVSLLSGSKPDGGSQTLEYGLVIGWTIQHNELPIPNVEELIPVFEIAGERTLNHGAGGNNITGDAAVRVNLKSIGAVQPRLGFGYIFPIDSGARNDFRWGIVTSLVFEY